MPCTTILVGRLASNDGSTMIARTDDGHFDDKKLIVVKPKDQPKTYRSVISHVEIKLPPKPLRYTSCPSVNLEHVIWPATGINAANVGMTATETITTNPRVLSADPLVTPKEAEGDAPAVSGGIGEENAKIAMELLDGKGRKTLRYAVGLNSGALLYLTGKAKSIKDGYDMALAALDSGKAKAKLEEIQKVSHAF